MRAMKKPRKCLKCGRWFYDSIFYPEGRHGCRWHDCDRIKHVTRTEELRPRGTTLLDALVASLGGSKRA